MNKNETICAISTPHGVGGIAIVRLAGENAKSIAEQSLRRKSGKKITLADHRAEVADMVLKQGDYLDEVVATYFAAPHSYTGGDVVEIACHGSLYVQQKMLQHFVDCGARLAEAGEFTMRAFANGRLNLSQAEAVADLIDAQSESAHKLAISQMRGGYASELETLREKFIELTSLLELELDFSDEDVEFANREHLRQIAEQVQAKVNRLLQSFSLGNAIKNGIPVAIVGRPNAGKSSLLNALVGEERAIVSPQPGTTRDTVEETIIAGGIMFRFIDTAGLRHSNDEIEQSGIKRSYDAMQRARIVLHVIDIADETAEESPLPHFGADTHVITVYNKADLPHKEKDGELYISATTGIGIENLKQSMIKLVEGVVNENATLTNARHYEAMMHIKTALDEVIRSMDADMPADLLVVDIRDALYHLGTITGQVTSDTILSTIFSRFCIGK